MGQHCSRLLDDTFNKKAGNGSNAPQRKPALLSWQRGDATSSKSAAAQGNKPSHSPSTNAADYAAIGLQGMKWQRLPGEINDQRINIDRCSQCHFFLVDQCDSVQIDECASCVFYIGPTCGSVFIRNCTDCVFVVACGQLRLRDAKRCTISLFTTGRPVIESSSDIKFCCFSARHQYFMLGPHLRKARMSAFNNLYWYVHDFTPGGRLNYHFIAQTEFESSYDAAVYRYQQQGHAGVVTSFDAVPVLSAAIPEYVSPEEDMQVYTSEVAIPFTMGCANAASLVVPQATLRTLLIFSADGLDEATQLVQAIELQRREYYALQGTGPIEQIVQLIATMEKVFTQEDVSQVLSVTSTKDFWSHGLPSNSGGHATSAARPPSRVTHVSDRDPAVVEDAVRNLVGEACICVYVATATENPPLLAVPRIETARAQRRGASQGGANDALIRLDVTRQQGSEAMERLANILFCSMPMSGSGFGGSH